MTTLYETSLEVNSQKDVATLLPAIVKRAASLVNVDGGGLYLVDPENETLELVVSYNLPRDYRGTIIGMGEGLSGLIASTGEALVVADYDHWEGRATAFANADFKRVLGVPLKVGQRVIGVLNMTDMKRSGSFNDEELRLVELVRRPGRHCVENARLHEATERELAERKRAQEALRRERDFTASVVDTTEALVMVLDPQGQIRLFNRKCEEVSGYKKEEVLGKVYWDILIPADQQEHVRTILGNWPDQLPPQADDGIWLTKDGRRVPLAWQNAVLPGATPSDALFISSGLDISERVKHEQEIERRNRELTILYEASRAANSTLDPAEAFHQVVHILATIGNYRFVSAHILEEGKLRLVESVGYETLLLEIEPSIGVHGRVMRTRRAAVCPRHHPGSRLCVFET